MASSSSSNVAHLADGFYRGQDGLCDRTAQEGENRSSGLIQGSPAAGPAGDCLPSPLSQPPSSVSRAQSQPHIDTGQALVGGRENELLRNALVGGREMIAVEGIQPIHPFSSTHNMQFTGTSQALSISEIPSHAIAASTPNPASIKMASKDADSPTLHRTLSSPPCAAPALFISKTEAGSSASTYVASLAITSGVKRTRTCAAIAAEDPARGATCTAVVEDGNTAGDTARDGSGDSKRGRHIHRL